MVSALPGIGMSLDGGLRINAIIHTADPTADRNCPTSVTGCATCTTLTTNPTTDRNQSTGITDDATCADAKTLSGTTTTLSTRRLYVASQSRGVD